MSDATSNVTIKIGSTGDFAAFTAAKEQVESLRTSVEAVRTTLESFGVTLGLVGIVEFGRSVNELAVSTVRLSEQAHISTEAFQALSYVAINAGLDQQGLAKSLEFLNKSMGLAAEGSTKQNLAIADLGLNTAELLAMPVEEQLAAIAKGYLDAADKGKAWADVIVLLGRNAAHMQQVLSQVGANGVPAQAWWMPTDADLQRIRDRNEGMERFWALIKGLAVSAYANIGNANPNMMAPGLQWMQDQGMKKAAGANPISLAPGGMSNKPGDLDNPIQDAPDPAIAIANQMEATLAALPAMQAAHRELTKALLDEAGAYEDLDQKAARERAEAAMDEAESKKLANANVADFAARIESVKLLTAASHLRAEANKAEAEADKQYIKDTIKEANNDYREEKKLGELKVSNLEMEETAREKLNAVALANIEHNWNETDNQKWADKKALLESNIAGLQAYIEKQDAIANDPLLPTEVSQKAKGASSRAKNTMAGQQGALQNMGPDPSSFTQQFSADLTKLQNQWGTLQQQMATGLSGVINSGLVAVENNITKAIQGTETWRKALMSIVTTIEGSVISAFVQMGVRWVATQIMMAVEGKAIAASSTAAMVPLAMAESEIWAAPAALATIASWGGAAVAAPMLVLAAMAATQGLALASEGGFFPGDPSAARGIFHGDEFVFSAPAVRNIGVENLERAHQMAKNPSAAGSAPAVSGGGESHSFHMHADYNAAFRAAMKDPANKKTILDTHRMAARHV